MSAAKKDTKKSANKGFSADEKAAMKERAKELKAAANKDGKVVCFFTAADKFKSRYATFGFNDDANLDEGSMWPTSWALTRLTPADEARIGALVKKAAS